MRGDRIGLIGPNGAGKIDADQADPRRHSRPTPARCGSAPSWRSPTSTSCASSSIPRRTAGRDHQPRLGLGRDRRHSRKHVMSYLGDFLFPPQRAHAPVSMLSGGERNRLLLARLFARPANLLVLDEPTNDLDIESLELLETTLQDYAGTLLLVSHDRAFLDNVVTQTLVAEGDGRWTRVRRRLQRLAGAAADRRRRASGARAASPPGPAHAAARAPRKLSLQGAARARRPARRDRGAGARTAGADRAHERGGYHRQGPDAIKADRERAEQIEHALAAKFERWARSTRRRGGPRCRSRADASCRAIDGPAWAHATALGRLRLSPSPQATR